MKVHWLFATIWCLAIAQASLQSCCDGPDAMCLRWTLLFLSPGSTGRRSYRGSTEWLLLLAQCWAHVLVQNSILSCHFSSPQWKAYRNRESRPGDRVGTYTGVKTVSSRKEVPLPSGETSCCQPKWQISINILQWWLFTEPQAGNTKVLTKSKNNFSSVPGSPSSYMSTKSSADTKCKARCRAHYRHDCFSSCENGSVGFVEWLLSIVMPWNSSGASKTVLWNIPHAYCKGPGFQLLMSFLLDQRRD